MTLDEFDEFLKKHSYVDFQPVKFVSKREIHHVVEVGESTGMVFRVNGLFWYDNHKGNMTYVSNEQLKNLTSDELYEELIRGLDVEQVTRITGYFSKVEQWNKGKMGELKDRNKSQFKSSFN